MTLPLPTCPAPAIVLFTLVSEEAAESCRMTGVPPFWPTVIDTKPPPVRMTGPLMLRFVLIAVGGDLERARVIDSADEFRVAVICDGESRGVVQLTVRGAVSTTPLLAITPKKVAPPAVVNVPP